MAWKKRSGRCRRFDRAKDASLLFIWGMAFNSDDGKISRQDFTVGPRDLAKREAVPGYYFVGRLTNDYASATFAETKKTLSLNHKEPLPVALAVSNNARIRRWKVQGPARGGSFTLFPVTFSTHDLSSSKDRGPVFIFHLMFPLFPRADTSPR